MPLEHRAYRFQLRPTRAQAAALERQANGRRFAYNWGLARWREYHAERGKSIPFKQLLRELTLLKREPDFEWLSEVDSQALQQALFDLGRAYRNFFERRARYPRFKSRKRDPQRFRIPQRVRLEGPRVYVPKVGWVRVRLSRPVRGQTRSATFKRDSAGMWFVTLIAELEVQRAAPRKPKPDHVVGVDLGIQDFAVLSTGMRIPAPRFGRKARTRIRRAHREVSRKQQGSRSRARAQAQLARRYRRTANQRHDFLHKLTTALVRQFDVIAIEDLGVTGLARTKLAGPVLDAGLSEFRRQLMYKARWHGKTLVIVERFFPSSRMCAACGTVNPELTPRMRRWTCPCGAVHDRDLNAARNLRAAALNKMVAVGRTDTGNACGAHVRPPTEAVNDEPGIPA